MNGLRILRCCPRIRLVWASVRFKEVCLLRGTGDSAFGHVPHWSHRLRQSQAGRFKRFGSCWTGRGIDSCISQRANGNRTGREKTKEKKVTEMGLRRAARIDANHTEIVKAMRIHGAQVIDTSSMGKGFPDLVVAYCGKTALVEVKDGAKSKSRRETTPAQKKFHAEWMGGTLCIVDGVEAAVRVLRLMESKDSLTSFESTPHER